MNIFVLPLSSAYEKSKRFLNYIHFFAGKYQIPDAYVTQEKLRKIEEK